MGRKEKENQNASRAQILRCLLLCFSNHMRVAGKHSDGYDILLQRRFALDPQKNYAIRGGWLINNRVDSDCGYYHNYPFYM